METKKIIASVLQDILQEENRYLGGDDEQIISIKYSEEQPKADCIEELATKLTTALNEAGVKWLTKRIAEVQSDYELAKVASYGTGLEYDSNAKQRMISTGGKLRAYKEAKAYFSQIPKP